MSALPAQVEDLLVLLASPPRLIAHLGLVHDVAGQLTKRISQHWPSLDYDREAVLLGAATHDIGKIVYREELIQPGKHHEEVGEDILLEHGFAPQHARFARTHGGPVREPHMQVEDWLVMLADDAWKGARRSIVEDSLRAVIAEATASPSWEVFIQLDELISPICAGADVRLDWHGAQLA